MNSERMELLFRQNHIIIPPIVIGCGILTGMARTSRQKQAVRTLPRRVVVALRMAGIAGQDKLNGIFEHLSAGHRWQLII